MLLKHTARGNSARASSSCQSARMKRRARRVRGVNSTRPQSRREDQTRAQSSCVRIRIRSRKTGRRSRSCASLRAVMLRRCAPNSTFRSTDGSRIRQGSAASALALSTRRGSKLHSFHSYGVGVGRSLRSRSETGDRPLASLNGSRRSSSCRRLSLHWSEDDSFGRPQAEATAERAAAVCSVFPFASSFLVEPPTVTKTRAAHRSLALSSIEHANFVGAGATAASGIRDGLITVC